MPSGLGGELAEDQELGKEPYGGPIRRSWGLQVGRLGVYLGIPQGRRP